MPSDGYIKFFLDWSAGPAPAADEIAELENWRARLYGLRLIGVNNEGVGYGNISRRTGPAGQFLISGTQTGALPRLTAAHYTFITGFEIDGNSVVSCGPVKPSSESLTHAAAYRALPDAVAAVHVHHSGVWRALIERGAGTNPAAEYGTPDLAREIMRRLPELWNGAAVLIGLAGHADGVLAVGVSLKTAAELLLAEISG